MTSYLNTPEWEAFGEVHTEIAELRQQLESPHTNNDLKLAISRRVRERTSALHELIRKFADELSWFKY